MPTKLFSLRRFNFMMDYLIKLGLISTENCYLYSSKTRDSDDCIVYKDKVTGVIFIKNGAKEIDQIIVESVLEGFTSLDELNSRTRTIEDNSRRLDLITKYQFNSILDFGCGSGLLISDLKNIGKEVFGVEIKQELFNLLSFSGLDVAKDINYYSNNEFDLITMFHVLEHLEDPLKILRSIREKLSDHGRLIIEVPNANDALLTLYDNDCFKTHTLWSEHRVLYTKKSLTILLELIGFSDIEVIGVQRYGLGNHINWIKNCKPNGDQTYELFNTDEFSLLYQSSLDMIDATDTLIAVAKR